MLRCLPLRQKSMTTRRKYAGPYEYFVINVDVRQPSECWLWKKSLRGKGYGAWNYEMSGYPRVGNAHRMTYILFNCDPHNMMVLHSCGNSRCCNPDHLYLGNNSRNMQDAVLHGTHRCDGAFKKGCNHVNNKLTENDVRQIKLLLTTGIPQRKIAEKYNISRGTVQNIKNKRSWSWLS